MAFKTAEELEKMKKKNPALAAMYVKRAKKSGTPVVSKDNPGYSEDSKKKKFKGKEEDEETKRRKMLGY